MRFEGGYQGRPNKLVDGCYSFWVGGEGLKSSPSLVCSLPPSLPPSLAHSLIRSPTHSLPRSLTTRSLVWTTLATAQVPSLARRRGVPTAARPPTRSHAHSHTHTLTRAHAHPVPPSLSPAHPLPPSPQGCSHCCTSCLYGAAYGNFDCFGTISRAFSASPCPLFYAVHVLVGC